MRCRNEISSASPLAARLRNESHVEIVSRIDDPVDKRILDQLLLHFPDFRRAYAEDGIAVEDFDSFGATRRTLRQFIAAVADLDALVRDVMLPDPG